MEAEIEKLKSCYGEDGELSEEYRAYLAKVLEENTFEENGQKMLYIGQDFYDKLRF